MTVADRAKATRTAINAARKAGQLGNVPANVRITVKAESFSQGSEIVVTVRGAADEWAYVGEGFDRRPSAAAKNLGDLLTEILAEHTDYSWGEVVLADGGSIGHVSRRGACGQRSRLAQPAATT